MSEKRTFLSSAQWFLVLLAMGLLIAWAFPNSPLLGDPTLYRASMAVLFAGGVPYVEAAFAHYPVTIIPMAAAWLAGGFASVGAFRVVFIGMMAGSLWATAVATRRVGVRVGIEGADVRWLAMAGPLFPLVLYRSDPWSVLLTVAALLGLVAGREVAGWFSTLAAAAAKGWPVVLAAVDWWRGRRVRAMSTVAGTFALTLWLLSTPGFRLGREVSSIHAETTVGALVGLWRAIRGHDLLVGGEIAAYIVAPPWMGAAAMIASVGLLSVALRSLRRPFSWPVAVTIPGVLVLSILVGSPLLSAQYLLWPTPFVALHPVRRIRVQMAVVASLTMVSVMVFDRILIQPVLYFGLVSLRNMLLTVLALDAVILLAKKGVPTSATHNHRPTA